MVDIDDFKRINDTYGHVVGDCVLKEVAYRLKKSLRKSDFIFRYGGEEFLILLPYVYKKDLKKVLEKVKDSISNEKVKCHGKQIKVTVSVGGAVFDTSVTSLEKLINKADRNLYEAKKTGKNKVIV